MQQRNSVSRRQFTRGGLLAGLGLVLMPLHARVTRAASGITYYTWAGYDVPDFHKAYDDKYGGEPNYSFFSDSEEAFQKLRQGFHPDLAHPCLPHVKRWKEAGLLKPVDPARIAAWNDLVPAMRDNAGVAFDDAHWIVPWEWGASSLIYRTDKIAAAEETYALLIDPANKGKVAIPDNTDEMAMLATLLAKVKDPYTLGEEDYKAIGAMMETLVGQSRFLWSDPTAAGQSMASGEVTLMWGWPNTWADLVKNGTPVKFMQKPAEGMITWMCGFALIAGGEGPEDEAYDLINASLEPAAGKALIEKYGYGHSNLKSFAEVDPKRLEALGMSGDVAGFLAKSNFLRARAEDQRQRLIELWNKAKTNAAVQ
ncbi:MAG TPA: extracellular solute-binding protein [Hypericibacter adhaerens]|uniref:ABC transporter substrate-binding protein n=1 Tax=Hypericibacter adhaerens TaxID=2602016 RepID=UPI002C3250F3|nr:extracellular solute-binding protein [Hypericibacter adhaerens]HWA42223.1 extracellular solute-binding protein [Hypericibacter adhaerens]